MGMGEDIMFTTPSSDKVNSAIRLRHAATGLRNRLEEAAWACACAPAGGAPPPPPPLTSPGPETVCLCDCDWPVCGGDAAAEAGADVGCGCWAAGGGGGSAMSAGAAAIIAAAALPPLAAAAAPPIRFILSQLSLWSGSPLPSAGRVLVLDHPHQAASLIVRAAPSARLPSHPATVTIHPFDQCVGVGTTTHCKGHQNPRKSAPGGPDFSRIQHVF